MYFLLENHDQIKSMENKNSFSTKDSSEGRIPISVRNCIFVA